MDFVHNVFHVLFAGFWNSVQHHPDDKEKSLKTPKVLQGIIGDLLKLKALKMYYVEIPEEVSKSFVWKGLVANHQGALFWMIRHVQVGLFLPKSKVLQPCSLWMVFHLQYHLFLDFWCNRSNLFPPRFVFGLPSQSENLSEDWIVECRSFWLTKQSMQFVTSYCAAGGQIILRFLTSQECTKSQGWCTA